MLTRMALSILFYPAQGTPVAATSTAQLLNGLTNGICGNPETIRDGKTPDRRNGRRAVGERQTRTSKIIPYAPNVGDLLDPSSLPQVGRSPSPPRAAAARASETTAEYIGGPRKTLTSLDEESAAKGDINRTTIETDKEFDHSVCYSLLTEREYSRCLMSFCGCHSNFFRDLSIG